MAFHPVLFPQELSAMAGTPTWSVDILRFGGGAEQRIALHTDALRRYDAATPTLTLAQYRAIMKHFNARRGQLHSFPLKDRMLYTATSEALGIGGGIGSTTQLIIDEGDASNSYIREIYLPIAGFQVRANGILKVLTIDYTVGAGANSGLLTWVTSVSGQTLTWTGEFNVPVRYDTPNLPDAELIVWRDDNTGNVQGPSIPLTEVRYVSEWA